MVQTYRHHHKKGKNSPHRGFVDLEKMAFLFSGSWGALLVILGDMGSTGNYFRELGSKFIALGI